MSLGQLYRAIWLNYKAIVSVNLSPWKHEMQIRASLWSYMQSGQPVLISDHFVIAFLK
jgi:hypothetical protein